MIQFVVNYYAAHTIHDTLLSNSKFLNTVFRHIGALSVV